MNAYTYRQLLSARKLDLSEIEYEIMRTEERLASLKSEHSEVIEDIKNLEERLYDESNVNNEE